MHRLDIPSVMDMTDLPCVILTDAMDKKEEVVFTKNETPNNPFMNEVNNAPKVNNATPSGFISL